MLRPKRFSSRHSISPDGIRAVGTRPARCFLWQSFTSNRKLIRIRHSTIWSPRSGTYRRVDIKRNSRKQSSYEEEQNCYKGTTRVRYRTFKRNLNFPGKQTISL